jgi:hypothetical protein
MVHPIIMEGARFILGPQDLGVGPGGSDGIFTLQEKRGRFYTQFNLYPSVF